MSDMIREIDRDLEVDVLALQALSSPSALWSERLGALGASCVALSVCCNTCGVNTVCVAGSCVKGTICVGVTNN